MNANVARQMEWSTRMFQNVIWPRMSETCSGGRLVMVESVVDEGFTKELDMLAGIDAWQVFDRLHRMRGIASRVQKRKFKTFTIRSQVRSGGPTEYHKRLEAIRYAKKGYLLPHLTVQGYVDCEGQFSHAGAVRTKDLYAYAEKYWDTLFEGNNGDGTKFRAVPWAALLAAKIDVRIITLGEQP